jgi:hypothetical protein
LPFFTPSHRCGEDTGIEKQSQARGLQPRARVSVASVAGKYRASSLPIDPRCGPVQQLPVSLANFFASFVAAFIRRAEE